MLFFNEDTIQTVKEAMDIAETEINTIKTKIEDYYNEYHMPKEHKKMIHETFKNLNYDIELLVYYEKLSKNVRVPNSYKIYIDNQIRVIERKNSIKKSLDILDLLANQYCAQNKIQKQQFETLLVDLRLKMITRASCELYIRNEDTQREKEEEGKKE